jgi:hypothetical protein
MTVMTISRVGIDRDGTRVVTGKFHVYTRICDGIEGQSVKLRVLFNYNDGSCQFGARCILKSDGSSLGLLQHDVVAGSAVYSAFLDIAIPKGRDISSVQLVAGLYETRWSKHPYKQVYGNKFIYGPKLEK